MIKNYEIEGWALSTGVDAERRLLQVIELLSTGADTFCLEAHFNDLHTLEVVAKAVPSSRFSLFGWTTIENESFFSRPECSSIQSARVVFGDQFLTVSRHDELPPYDWDGIPNNIMAVSLVERHVEPVKADSAEPSQCVLAFVKQLSEDVGARQIKASTSMKGDYRDHNYMAFLHRSKIANFLGSICAKLRLENGIGAFEILGTAAILRLLINQGNYRLGQYPSNCWSFNDGVGKTPFALERASFLYPVLNLNSSSIIEVIGLLDSLKSSVCRTSVTRKYLSWKVDGQNTPKTQNNYIRLSKQKSGYALLIGYEQFSNSDTSVAQFASEATSILGRFGAKLKPIPYIK